MFRLSARASTSLFRRTVLVHIRTYYRSAMGTTGIDTAPPTHRGMTQLDRNAFHKEVSILAARVPAAKAGLILRASQTKRAILDLPKIKTVEPDPRSPDGRLVLLGLANEAELTSDVRDFLDSNSAEIVPHTLVLDYDYWLADEILRSILPEELIDGAPAGFAATGHIAHMNLNDEYLPYKHLIGQVILDKNKKLRTVVNKLDSIDTKFRFFKMELIAGEPNYIVQHHESDCTFTFDFTQVYWNSRLHTEHARLVGLFRPEDVVADVFAGVGPFALPAAKKGCAVWANDLNPNSHKYLQINVDHNKMSDRVQASCEDGRDFIRTIARRAFDNPFSAWTGPKPSRTQQRAQRKDRDTQSVSKTDAPGSLPPRIVIGHFVMNLPDSALTFLDAFRGILSDPDLREVYKNKTPVVHCHCFTRELEFEAAKKDIFDRAEEKLGHPLGNDASLHLVRSVAPNKEMYCLSFKIPPEVAFE